MRRADDVEHAVRKMAFKAGPDMDRGIWADTSKAQSQSQKTTLATGRNNARRTIMKSPITKLAAAAVIITAVLIGIHHFGSPIESVAWAEVLARVERIPVVTYRRTEILPQGSLGSQINQEAVYLSSERRIRVDSYAMGGVRPDSHWISMYGSDHEIRIHKYEDGVEPPYGGVMIYMDEQGAPSSEPGVGLDENFERWKQDRLISPDDYPPGGRLLQSQYLFASENIRLNVGRPFPPSAEKVYRGYCSCELLEEDEAVRQYKHMDPREWVKEALSLDYRELGRDNIGGIEVEGVEVTGHNLSVAPLLHSQREVLIRFWVDIKTGLPVRYEAKVGGNQFDGDWAVVADEFQWNQQVDPSLFEPAVFADCVLSYVRMPGDHIVIDFKTPMEESVLTQGLGVFAELADGQYPRSMVTAVVEASKAYRQKHGYEAGGTSETLLKTIESIASAAVFYGKLVDGGKDAAYYGDTVMADDADAVLMRWKVSDNEYRVIFGSLNAQTVTAQELAELEKRLSQ